MSCEIEPFKQAYIGRNFPGVPLFPDITKLTDPDGGTKGDDNDNGSSDVADVADVYGRPRRVPDGNLFVAGTSCKDFSMLKTSHRQDIEDKGTSGETFLAAVEFLEQKKPPVAIFENVDGAPWSKMEEYITGRVELCERNNAKSIKAGKKPDADKDLKFSVNKDGRYVAEEVPRQVGIRAGSVVEGFVRGSGGDPSDVIDLYADDKALKKKKKKKEGLITLGEMAKCHKINLNDDTLVLFKKARYRTHLCKVDTKEYGLPQTRQRKYLFIWRSDDPSDDLGTYFQQILDHLKTPLLYSMDAFLLSPSHDRIRCFREALRSGPGLMVARERSKEPDFWDWTTSRNLDTPRHVQYRRMNGIDDRSRWITGWNTRGRKTVAPGLWPELADMWNHRRLDMVDCFAAAAARDAIPRDALHHSFTWDLSQNVTRAPFRSATVGVSGCVTPGGELLLPHRGRTVMGYEKLLLQGIPFSRLLLGPETEVQLSDLAGNAMSVPVVCATMLAAICAPYLRREVEADKKASIENFALGHKYDSAGGAVLPQRGDLFKSRNDDGEEAEKFEDVFPKVAKELAMDAYLSSVLCSCESSGRTSSNPTLLECTGCGMGICHDCSGKQRVDSHELREILNGALSRGEVRRPDPHEFERRLRCASPSILRLTHGSESFLPEGHGLESYSFQLQGVDRERGRWILTYGAWEDYGSARQVAEVRVSVGRTGTLEGTLGVSARVRCFGPSIRDVDPHRGRLGDSARLIVKVGDIHDDAGADHGEHKNGKKKGKNNNKGKKAADKKSAAPAPKWEIPSPAAKTRTLRLVGSNPSPSQRVQIGLNDDAPKALRAHKPQKQFIPKNLNSRNSVTTYHPKWKTWPGIIAVSGDDRVSGTYTRMKCEQTVAHSALWRRESNGNSNNGNGNGNGNDDSPMYIYIRPDVIRSGLDTAVFSPTPSYRDDGDTEIAELIDWIPENALVEKTYETETKFMEWTEISEEGEEGEGTLGLEVPPPSVDITSPSASASAPAAGGFKAKNGVKAKNGAKKTQKKKKSSSSSAGGDDVDVDSGGGDPLLLCEMNGLSREVVKSLLQHNNNHNNQVGVDVKGGQDGSGNIVSIDLVGKSATRNAKRLSIVAAPSLLKYAAEGKLPLKLSMWYPLSSLSGNGGFGSCEANVPPRPLERWKRVPGKKKGDVMVRWYDPEESNEYYARLLKRPTAFRVTVDESEGNLVVKMDPTVAAHHAASPLVRGRASSKGGEDGPNDDDEKDLAVDYRLSELSSMGEPATKEFHVPNSDMFEETSVPELELPLYSRQSKALARMLSIERGDVRFSEEERSEHVLPGIGWCLIARAAKKSPLRGGVLGDAIGSGKTVVTIALILKGAQAARKRRDKGKGRSGATLIVVPPGLVQQWDDERRKFTKNKLKCITVDCAASLKEYSVKDLCEADMVIVPASILEERPAKGNTKGRPYTEHLAKKAGMKEAIPPAPTGYSQREAPTIEGTWVRNMASGPAIYVGNQGKQRTRDEQAYYGHCYSEAISKLRQKTFKPTEKGVPLEYFTWERVVIDECHETLVTCKSQETDAADFKAQARRGAREFLGVAQTDVTKRPLVASAGVWGLTGTPLLETEARVTELANLMGGTYVTGAARHWRREERESGRDLFLNQREGAGSREYRCAVQEACHSYVTEACQRNRGTDLEVNLSREIKSVNMSKAEGKKFLGKLSEVQMETFTLSPDQLGEKAGGVLSITATSEARHRALGEALDSIHESEPHTKIVVFANAFYGGYDSALSYLESSGRKFCRVSSDDTVQQQNEVISWFRHVDATEEDRSRPRVLLLSFEQAAGHNLQEACHHVIMYDPMYSGSDAVADASVEEQAVGRVMRQGQKDDVTVTRIVVKGPGGERCLDDWIVERNLDENVLQAATSNFD
uniref:Helicase ATP-binding domain-containing protein n=1 Tax=Odontella aurita TaxID=265563 RepID=A0A7S4I449_9STRA